MNKYLLSLLVICESAFVTSLANAATTFYPYDSSNVRENVPLSATVQPRKKIVFVDRANAVTRSFTQGCATGTVAIGIAHMPKNANYSTKMTPISHNSYKFNISDYEVGCSTLVYYWYEYTSWNPTWVTGFQTPQIICAPIKLVWGTVTPPPDSTNEIPSGDTSGPSGPGGGTGTGEQETDVD